MGVCGKGVTLLKFGITLDRDPVKLKANVTYIHRQRSKDLDDHAAYRIQLTVCTVPSQYTQSTPTFDVTPTR